MKKLLYGILLTSLLSITVNARQEKTKEETINTKRHPVIIAQTQNLNNGTILIIGKWGKRTVNFTLPIQYIRNTLCYSNMCKFNDNEGNKYFFPKNSQTFNILKQLDNQNLLLK